MNTYHIPVYGVEGVVAVTVRADGESPAAQRVKEWLDGYRQNAPQFCETPPLTGGEDL